MKVVGILRGFPGLGRVVSGVEIIRKLERKHNANVKIISYLQGYDYVTNYYTNDVINILNINDISSIGIIPVSPSGEKIIDDIDLFKPDVIIIDGEPLLLITIKLRFPNIKIITLLNPFDIDNPHNKLSSQLFFKDCYSKADISIVHGLFTVKQPESFEGKFYSVGTVIRQNVQEITRHSYPGAIKCILGGGTVNSSSKFYENTIKIAENAIMLANKHKELKFEIFCSCKVVFDSIKANQATSPNLSIYIDIESPERLFSDAKIVIGRAGRNLISELLFHRIPSIVFASNCGIRGAEQSENISAAQNRSKNIIGMDISASKENIHNVFERLLRKNISPDNLEIREADTIDKILMEL